MFEIIIIILIKMIIVMIKQNNDLQMTLDSIGSIGLHVAVLEGASSTLEYSAI